MTNQPDYTLWLEPAPSHTARSQALTYLANTRLSRPDRPALALTTLRLPMADRSATHLTSPTSTSPPSSRPYLTSQAATLSRLDSDRPTRHSASLPTARAPSTRITPSDEPTRASPVHAKPHRLDHPTRPSLVSPNSDVPMLHDKPSSSRPIPSVTSQLQEHIDAAYVEVKAAEKIAYERITTSGDLIISIRTRRALRRARRVLMRIKVRQLQGRDL